MKSSASYRLIKIPHEAANASVHMFNNTHNENRDVIVTVIIPVYNSAPTLNTAIVSAANQTLRDIEIIVYDDGSIDDSFEVARKAAESDSRIIVRRVETNGGKSTVMNAAIAMAKGKWIAILDADDTYQNDRLEVLVKIGEQTNADLVADNQNHFDGGTGELFLVAFPSSDAVTFLDEDKFISSSNSSSTFDYGILKPMIRREFIESNALKYNIAARFAQDFYYLMEFFVRGGKAAICHKPLYNWTLPFSPSTRTWSVSGNGAWRYNYAKAIATNNLYLTMYRAAGRTKWVKLLERREREYLRMQHYIHAQRLFEEEGRKAAGAIYILRHPRTWSILIKRIFGRVYRQISNKRKPE